MSNSNLFKQAHKMTKLTIQPNETYRYKFGQWLIFLKTGITNVLRLTNINQSVCYVPILKHDIDDKVFITPFDVDSFTYSLSLPLTLNRRKQSGYTEAYYIGNMLLTSKYLILAIILLQFILVITLL